MNTIDLTARIGLNDRLSRLKAEVMARGGSFIPQENPFILDAALMHAWKPGRSIVQIRAALLREFVARAPIDILPEWHLAGEHLIPGVWWYVHFGSLNETYTDQRKDHLAQLGFSEEAFPEIEDKARRWTDRTFHPLAFVGEEGVTATPGNMWDQSGNPVYSPGGWIENHSIRDYAKVLRLGFAGIRREIEAYLAEADFTDPTYLEKENFWRAGLAVCDAGILLGQRYAELAASRAEQVDDPAEAARLRVMAEVCSHVPAEGARTFFEAVNSIWLAHILTCAEDGINANSIGRLDQILYPYYQADIDTGRITPDAARELMEELACKLYLDYDVQAITLGGMDREGNSAVNDLSYLILEATRNVDFIRDLSVRLTPDTPQAFIDLVAELTARGGGIPFVFNDECFVPAITEHGIPLEDARDYSPIGCVELTIPGKANPHAVSAWFNSAACLELALFDGNNPLTGKQIGPHTGKLTDYATFDDLLAAYKIQVEQLAREMVYFTNRGELLQRERGPLPCLSVLTDDCIARGRDITDGGPLYNYHSICLLGTANTADSLIAIKKLVYDEHKIDPSELLAALQNNFSGEEMLRQMLLKQAPKYGNDQEEVDQLASIIDEHFITQMDRYTSPLHGHYVVHLFSFLCNIHFGKMLGATPDGRKAREPIAYSLSAQQGRDESGVTAMLNSLAKLPHKRAAGASAAIVEIDPKLVAGEQGPTRLAYLIQAAMKMGIGQLQWNVTTVERLKQAQDDPEHYGNIPVRVAGYSQMFKLLERDLQDHIIARTKHQS